MIFFTIFYSLKGQKLTKESFKLLQLRILDEYAKFVSPKYTFYSEYRTIVLVSHSLNLLLTIINDRIEEKLDENQSETQYGFVAEKGSRDAIALLKVVIQRVPKYKQGHHCVFH